MEPVLQEFTWVDMLGLAFFMAVPFAAGIGVAMVLNKVRARDARMNERINARFDNWGDRHEGEPPYR